MEKKNNVLGVFLAIFIFTTLALGGYVIYHNFFKVDTNEQDCSKCDTCVCHQNDQVNCTKAGVTGEQMMYSSIGTVFISATGNVYFNPDKNTKIHDIVYNMEDITKKAFGAPKTYEPKSEKFPNPAEQTFSYKLDLTNVRFVTEVELGNAGTNVTFIFVHYDGRVSELSFFDGGLEKMDGSTADLKLYKYVSSYSNIVSVVQDDDYDSYGAKLYDKCGNGIEYKSPRP